MPNRPHIHLDDELENLSALIAQMGGIVEQQVSDAIESLSRRESALAEEAIARDDAVNKLQIDVEEAAAMALALQQPVSRDLREIVATIKIATNLERMGDLAKGMAKRALVLNRERPVKLVAGLVRMGRLVLSQTKRVLDAYAAHDVEMALEVWTRDEEIDELYNSLFREFLTYMMEDPRTIGLCTHLLFVAKSLERIGDHATNIGEVVYYVEKAQFLSAERPKGSSTQPLVVVPERKDSGEETEK